MGLDRLALRMFRGVHPQVGAMQQGGEIIAVSGKAADADAGGDGFGSS